MAWSILLFAILLLSVLIQLIYQWYFFCRIAFYKPKSAEKKPGPVSVVISAKNEYSNLKQNLPLILEQKFPKFEVVVVNDRSIDDTKILLDGLKSKYSHLNVIHMTNPVTFIRGKKLPLSVGIKSSKYDTLVLTDADCRPASPLWLKNIERNFKNDTEIVLGYGAYEKKKGLLNTLIRYDTLTIAMNYLSFALAGIPYMGVGRNLAYKKELFYKAAGFTSHYKVISGDDDLFINKTANRKNCAVEISPESFTISEPKTSFKDWFSQKRRHLLTWKYYRNKFKFLLGLLAFSNFTFYLSLCLVIIFTEFWLWGLILFIIRSVGLVVNYYYIAKNFNENILFLYSLIFDVIFTVLNPVISISNIFYKKDKWK